MIRCKDCKHWENARHKVPYKGWCNCPKFIESEGMTDNLLKDGLQYYCNGKGAAYFCTGEDFGCIHGEEK